MTQPLALSISGGGSLGARSVGVVQALVEVGELNNFPIIYGTSTGALIAAMLGMWQATGDSRYYQQIIKLYSDVLDGDILASPGALTGALTSLGGTAGGLVGALLEKKDSIYSVEPLQKLIDRFMPTSNWEILIKAAKDKIVEVGFACTNMRSGQGEIFTTLTHPNINVLRSAILASACQPVLMPFVEINQVPYSDGGIVDYNPVEYVFSSRLFSKVRGVITISVDSPTPQAHSENLKGILAALEITLKTFVGNVFKNDLNGCLIRQLLHLVRFQLGSGSLDWKNFINSPHFPPELRSLVKEVDEYSDVFPPIIRHFYPSKPINQDALSFKQPQMEKLLHRGFRETVAVLKKQPLVFSNEA